MQIKKLSKSEFPPQLLEIPAPPKDLWVHGNLPPPDAKVLCVVGARRHTQYGKDVCEKLISSLKGKNVSIVSGLAIGIDTVAHKAALNAGLHTLAVPGSGLGKDVLYPNANRKFAEQIVEAGGGLLSEFEPDFASTIWAFPKRNRIMSGISHAVLIIEAEKKSGTLITARLATDYNRDVLTIPGSIFSPNSEGPHLLLKLGATPITCSEDLHEALGFALPHETQKLSLTFEERYPDCSETEKKILHILQDAQTRDDLIRKIELPTHEVNILISLLEMKGYIKENLGQLHLIF